MFVLLSEHVKSVILALSKQISIKNVYCWSDSLITLWWIKQNHKTWKLWIRNSVKKIREDVNTEHWNYVISENKAADVATRRTSPNSLAKNLLWRNGPSFLEGDEDSWLKVNCTKDGVSIDFSSNAKAKQCLAREELLVECCDSENVVCSLITDLKGNAFGVVDVIDVVRFGDLDKTFAGDCVYLSVCC